MASKSINFKMNEDEIAEMKSLAGVFHMTVTDFLKNAIHQYEATLKDDPFYRLSCNVQDASREETDEILSAIDKLSDDDMQIVSSKTFTV